MKWSLDFIGHVKPMGRHIRNKHILVVIGYATKWVKAKGFHSNMAVVMAKFLYECILTRFGCPLTMVQIRECISPTTPFSHLVNHLFFHHMASTTYYPQGNGQVEYINKRVKTQSKEPQRASNVRFCHKKLKIIYFLPLETMVIMVHSSFFTHMNVKKIKLKIHLFQL